MKEYNIKSHEMKCPICNERGSFLYLRLSDRLFEAPGIWNIMICPKCSITWLSPLPEGYETRDFYQNYFTHQKKSVQTSRPNWKKRIAPLIISESFAYKHLVKKEWVRLIGRMLSLIPGVKNLFAREISWLKFKPHGKLLEIGCGNGDFLAKMRDWGWETFGIEPDPIASEIARQKHQISITTGFVEDTHLPKESFDAIIMHHVIEHHPDPIGLLKICRHLLKTDGQLIIVTPNINSFGHNFFRQNWVHLDPPRHFYLFSPFALKKLAEIAGFQVNQVTSIVFLRFVIWTWVASQLIKKRGKYTLKSIGLKTKLPAMTFFSLEKILAIFYRDRGEEILLKAMKVTKNQTRLKSGY